jgi:adenylate cyclase
MAEEVDFAAEGLLDGLDGEERAGRLALLQRLHADGVSLHELRRAVEEDRLVLLPLERVLGGAPELTLAEVADRSGLDPDVLLTFRSALGLPAPDRDAPVLTEAEVEAAQRLKSTLDLGMPVEGMIDLNRVLGRSMAQIAAAMRPVFGGAYLQPGDREDELAARYADSAEALLPNLGPALQNIFALHLRELLRSAAVDAGALRSGTLSPETELTVAFADLVGFTWLGGQVPPDELGRIARRLEELAAGVVRSPARLVKTIGDAVMLVSPRPGPLLDAVLALVAAADAEGDQGEDFPRLRAGLALGPAQERDGDVFGHAVNLASRITALARPGSVLATQELRDALADGPYAWTFAGARRIKGVAGEVKLYRVRPAGDERPRS